MNKRSDFFTPEKHKPYYEKVESGLFISSGSDFNEETDSKSYGYLTYQLQIDQIKEDPNFIKFVKICNKQFLKNLKIVTNLPFNNSAFHQYLLALQFKITKTILLQGVFEIIFEPHNNRLRVANSYRGKAHSESKDDNTLNNNFEKKSPYKLNQKIPIAIGASTGGVEALKILLENLPKEIPPILIAQHIPAGYSKNFANRMNKICPFEVKEASNHDELIPNRVLIAPGGLQMTVTKKENKFFVQIFEDSIQENKNKPSVDLLFHSVAKHIGKDSIGIILTGMGDDGSSGMLAMKNAGSYTIAQDESTSVVFGMPNEAIKKGAVNQVLPLQEIPQEIIRILSTDNKIISNLAG